MARPDIGNKEEESYHSPNHQNQRHTKAYHCAFSFPAVVYTVGASRWDRLAPLFKRLVRDERRAVRRVMSHSLHELARLLGTEITERDLVDAFNLFLRDLDDVKIGAVKHMAAFLKEITEPIREKCMKIIKDTCANPKHSNWRFRLLLAKQIDDFVSFLSPVYSYDVIVPLCFELIDDPVHLVGDSACKALGKYMKGLDDFEISNECVLGHVLVYCEDNNNRKAQVCNRILELKKARSYSVRQQFVRICHAMIGFEENVQLFKQQFLEPLVDLSSDKVSNVRLLVANVLLEHKFKFPKDKIETALKSLREDNSRDIALLIQGIVEKESPVEC